MLDLESLLRPISDDAPCGENLRDDPSPDSPYYRVKDARNAARAAERAAQMADDPSSAEPADWSQVLAIAPRILSERSKDLEIAAWLIEALVRKEHFEGLHAGFELVRGLVERFWDDLHPRPDEDGIRTRVGPISGLNGEESEGTLIVPIGMVPLLLDGRGAVGTWHFRSAREVAALTDPEARRRRIEAGAVTMERIEAAVAESDASELLARRQSIEDCIAEYGRLIAAFDVRCGGDAPPASNIRTALADALDCMRYLTRHLDSQPQPGAEAAAAESQGAPRGAAAPSAPGVIGTRDDAVAALARVSDFFRRTEPHSPLSYVVDQAVRWSKMPLHQLIAELIPDSAALSEFQLRTGVPRAPNSDE